MNGTPDLPDDDAPVEDDVQLYRLVPCDQCTPVRGEWEFQSAAFDNNDGLDMSVVLADTLAAVARNPHDLPEDIFHDRDRWGVAVITDAGYLRNDEDQEILRTPNDDERAHGDVRGTKAPKRRKRIKRHAEWIIPPTRPAPASD